MHSQDNNFIISPKCGNSEELEIEQKLGSIKMSKKSKSLSGEEVEFEAFSKQTSHGRTSGNSLIAHKLALGSDQNIKRQENSSHRIIKINPLTPRKKLDLKTVSGKASSRNLQKSQMQLSSEAKRRETKKWSKKTSVLSYNMSSLLSSGVNQSESGRKKTQGNESELEEVKKLKAHLKKNERRVQRIIQDNKRRNETYKRIWDNQNSKIKHLEHTVKKVNRENNEIKKDLKIVVEMRKFLQRRVNFLEDQNRKLMNKGNTQHEKVTDFKILGTEMMEVFHSPSREMDGDDLTIKHYNSNKNSILNSFDKNKSRNLDVPGSDPKPRKPSSQIRNLQISIPEQDAQDSTFKRKMRFQIRPKSIIGKGDIQRKKKPMSIIIPEEDSELQVKSTRLNKKFHFENEKPSGENTQEEQQKAEFLFEKKKHADKHDILANQLTGKFGKHQPVKTKAKRPKRKTKKFQKSNSKVYSSSNLEKSESASQKIYTSHKRLHKKNMANGFLDSMKREKKRRIRRGTEGGVAYTNGGNEALLSGTSALRLNQRIEANPQYRKKPGEQDDFFKKKFFLKSKINKKKAIKSVKEMDSQKYIRRNIKKISIDPQERADPRDWALQNESEEDLRQRKSSKLTFSNRDLVVERIKTEPVSKLQKDRIEFPDRTQNTSFRVNKDYKNNCSISDIRQEKKIPKKSQILRKNTAQDFDQIFSIPSGLRKRAEMRNDFGVAHLLHDRASDHFYRNFDLTRPPRKSELLRHEEEFRLRKVSKPLRVSENMHKPQDQQFSKQMFNENQLEGKPAFPNVTAPKKHPLNLTGYRKGGKKKERLSVNSGMAFQTPNYTRSGFGIVGQKYKTFRVYPEGVIGKKSRKSKAKEKPQKILSKDRKRKRKNKKKNTHKLTAKNFQAKRVRQKNTSNQKQILKIINTQSKETLGNQVSDQKQFPRYCEDLKSLEMAGEMNNTFEAQNKGLKKNNQYYSCKSIQKEGGGKNKNYIQAQGLR